jgi:hypothetical protein
VQSMNTADLEAERLTAIAKGEELPKPLTQCLRVKRGLHAQEQCSNRERPPHRASGSGTLQQAGSPKIH